MKKHFILFAIFGLIPIAMHGQWKVNETFNSEIPAQWTGNFGNPGYSWVASAGGKNGVAKGTTGNETSTQYLYSPIAEVSAGDSVMFNHYLIVTNSDDFQVGYKVNGGAANYLLTSTAMSWINEKYLLTDLPDVTVGDNIQFVFQIGVETANSCYIDYFKIGKTPASAPPACVQLHAPADAAVGTSINTTLTWNPAESASEYLVYFGTDNPPTNLVNGISNLLDTTFRYSESLLLNQTYYWQIVSSNNQGVAADCPIYSFTTQEALYPISEGFERSDLSMPNAWTVIDEAETTYMNVWHPAYNGAGNGNGGSFGFMSISVNVTQPKASWLFTEPLPMTTDKLYRITFYYKTLADGAYEYMEVKFGQSPNIESMTSLIWQNENINKNGWYKAVCYVKPESNSDHFVSWHAYSEPNEFNLTIDDILIEELDAQPGAYTIPYICQLPVVKTGLTHEFTLPISNQGYGTLDLLSADYPDFIIGPDEFSISETADVPFTFAPETNGLHQGVITLETNGGTIEIPVWGNSATKALPITGVAEYGQNFSQIDVAGDYYMWSTNTFRTYEGAYSLQVTENMDATGYDDWLITKPSYVMPGDVFTYYARSLTGGFGPAYVGVKVSPSAGNSIASMTETLQSYQYIPGEWTGYSFDLSEYAGEIITIGIHSNNTSWSAMAHYFDNFGTPSTSNPMTCASGFQPTNGASNVTVHSPTISWEPVPGAVNYRLYLGTDNPPTNIENGTDLGNVTSYTTGELVGNTNHLWKVIPTFGDFEPTSCSVIFFKTEDNSGFSTSDNPDISIFQTSDGLRIESPNADIQSVKIYGIDGKLLFDKANIFCRNIEIPIKYKGIVPVVLNIDNQIITRKLVLK